MLWAAKLSGRGHIPAPSAAPVAAGSNTFSGTLLGIDPSLRGTGLAIVEFDSVRGCRLINSTTVRNPRQAGLPECLAHIARNVRDYLNQTAIDCVVLEQTIYVQNFQTAQTLGAVRGAAIAVAAMHGYPVYEYAPLRIKQAVVGFGRASKHQVAAMIQRQLGMSKPLPADEADAAAAAYCHAISWRAHNE